jgi:hypothetical protein
MKRSDIYLETVNLDASALNFEQVSNTELFLLQIIDSEKLNSLSCFENIAVGVHHSLYRTYSINTDLTNLLVFLLIPNY